jgi:hypothetical protein
MPETTPAFIARGLAYCDAATEPPWYSSSNSVGTKPNPCGGYPPPPDVLFNQDDGEYVDNPNAEADGIFAAQSRTDLPRALKALEYAIRRLKDANVMFDDEGELDRSITRIVNGEEVDDG